MPSPSLLVRRSAISPYGHHGQGQAQPRRQPQGAACCARVARGICAGVHRVGGLFQGLLRPHAVGLALVAEGCWHPLGSGSAIGFELTWLSWCI